MTPSLVRNLATPGPSFLEDGEKADAELLKAFASGDVEAYGLLYRRHYHHLLRMASAYFVPRNGCEAKDLVQKTFEIALLRIGQHNRTKSFGGWVRKILWRLILDEGKRKGPEGSLGYEGALDERVSSRPDCALENQELRQRIDKAMEAIPEQHRRQLTLSIVEGLAHKEVGKIIGCTEYASKDRLQRARAAFKKAFGPRD